MKCEALIAAPCMIHDLAAKEVMILLRGTSIVPGTRYTASTLMMIITAKRHRRRSYIAAALA